MSIVRNDNDGADLFRIVLPEDASAEQEALKAKIDTLLETLKQKQSDPNHAAWMKKLRTVAEEGFDASPADPAAAITQLDELTNAITEQKPEGTPPSRLGAFEVTLPDPTDEDDKGISWREIIFNVVPELLQVPPAQLKLQNTLKQDVEATLTTLHTMFPDKETVEKPKHPTARQHLFAAYQTKLLGIAQTGLQTPADPGSSRQWLESLQAEILMREGPRIKNGYMKKLGVAAAGFAALAAIIYLVLRRHPDFSQLLTAYRNLFALWAGTMVGTWLSFGLRRPKIAFKELGALEDDMLEPAIRLIFTGLIAFIFACKMVSVTIGGLNSADLVAHGSSALLIGMLLGVGEQALPGVLTRRASQFVSEVGGKT